MRSLAPGEVVLLLATDPAVEADLHAWCESTGATLERFEPGASELKAWVRKGY